MYTWAQAFLLGGTVLSEYGNGSTTQLQAWHSPGTLEDRPILHKSGVICAHTVPNVTVSIIAHRIHIYDVLS